MSVDDVCGQCKMLELTEVEKKPKEEPEKKKPAFNFMQLPRELQIKIMDKMESRSFFRLLQTNSEIAPIIQRRGSRVINEATVNAIRFETKGIHIFWRYHNGDSCRFFDWEVANLTLYGLQPTSVFVQGILPEDEPKVLRHIRALRAYRCMSHRDIRESFARQLLDLHPLFYYCAHSQNQDVGTYGDDFLMHPNLKDCQSICLDVPTRRALLTGHESLMELRIEKGLGPHVEGVNELLEGWQNNRNFIRLIHLDYRLVLNDTEALSQALLGNCISQQLWSEETHNSSALRNFSREFLVLSPDERLFLLNKAGFTGLLTVAPSRVAFFVAENRQDLMTIFVQQIFGRYIDAELIDWQMLETL